MKSLLLLALGLARTVVLGARIEAERIVVSVRPYKREQRRCPVCGRACDFYDMANRGAPRLWRAMDLARSACYLEYAPCRVRCPEHGVRTEAVPWARHGARFTRDFEDWVAWLAVRCTASAVSELARVEWHSVGGVCRRVYAELEAARGASRFDGVRRIGIDETSYKKGHKYVTVVVDHDRGCLIWAHEGTGKDVLNLFLDELTREQRRAIEVVTADGARWIRQLVKRRCPNARWVMDPFHVVQWMNDALDAVRCEEWNAARAAARAARPRPEGKRGRPAKGELPPEEVRALEEEAASIKGSRYALVKNPEDLTDGQRARLEALKKRAGSRLGQGLGAQGGPAGRLPGSRRLRGRRAARRLDAQGRLLQDRQGRRRGEEGAPPARRHHRRSRARHQQRARRGHQQQDQGGGEDGLRLPQHRQPRGPAHAQVRRLPAPAPGSPGEGEEEGREGSEERCCLG